MSHEKELIQVMAVACASLENERYGQAAAEAWWTQQSELGEYPTMQAFGVLDDVFTERVSQDEKWGQQEHSRIEWAMILAEEIGEWADEISAVDVIEALDGDVPEQDAAFDILMLLSAAGLKARKWLEGHEWPERQQEVYDAEGVSE
jgi:hypothetical protein